MNKELAEKYCKLHGWEKVDGYKFNIEGLDEDGEEVYFDKEQFEDRKKECTFWTYSEAYENVYEDIEDVIDYIQNNMDVPSFEKFAKNTKEVKER